MRHPKWLSRQFQTALPLLWLHSSCDTELEELASQEGWRCGQPSRAEGAMWAGGPQPDSRLMGQVENQMGKVGIFRKVRTCLKLLNFDVFLVGMARTLEVQALKNTNKPVIWSCRVSFCKSIVIAFPLHSRGRFGRLRRNQVQGGSSPGGTEALTLTAGCNLGVGAIASGLVRIPMGGVSFPTASQPKYSLSSC